MDLSGGGVKAVSLTGDSGFSAGPHCSDLSPALPTPAMQCPPALLVATLRLLVPCGPPPHRFLLWAQIPLLKLFWKSSCTMTPDPGRLLLHGHRWFQEAHMCNPCLVGKQCGPKPQALIVASQPTVSFGLLRQEADHSLPPPPCREFTKLYEYSP